WKKSRIVDQRLQFLSSYQKEEMSVADLCRAYGISRPTAYRWINRYNETGPEGLVDRSSRPHSCSHATLEPIENTILVLRAKHPSWGARKLKARLEMLQPDVVWPAASTFGQHPESLWLSQSSEEEKTHHAMLRAVLDGHRSESVVWRPQQNGRHERHRTLKEDTTKPPGASLR